MKCKALFFMSLTMFLFLNDAFALFGVGNAGVAYPLNIPISRNYCCENKNGRDSWSQWPCVPEEGATDESAIVSRGTSVSNDVCGKMKCYKDYDGVPEVVEAGGDHYSSDSIDDKMCQKIQGCCVSERECPEVSGAASREIKPGGDVFFWAKDQNPYGACGQGWSFAESSKCDKGKCVPSGNCTPKACPSKKTVTSSSSSSSVRSAASSASVITRASASAAASSYSSSSASATASSSRSSSSSSSSSSLKSSASASSQSAASSAAPK